MPSLFFIVFLGLPISIWAFQPAKQQSTEMSGETIYEQYCSVCHRDGIAGAPRFRVVADWQKRLVNKTIDDLVAIAIKGENAMPAKGTCYECSDDDLKNAIQFMLPQS